MWQCKICGKKFNKEPIYCSHCGATDNFLVKINPKDSDAFYKEVENSFHSPVSTKSFSDYDDMIKDFLADEYIPVSRKVKEPFEDEIRLKAEKEVREEKLKSIDHEYYESIKTYVGADGIEKEDYYKSLENLFQEPVNKDETTFNGLFSKDNTMENTFLKPKQKEKWLDKINGKAGGVISKLNRNINFSSLGRALKKGGKGGEEILVDAEKRNSKLTKVLIGLLGLFIFLAVLMGFLVNNIASSGSKSSSLPNKTAMLSFFTTVKGMDEITFLENSNTLVSFTGYEGSAEGKKVLLQELHAMVVSEDFKVKGVKDISRKGSNRVLVDFNITGNKIAVDAFSQLLFRTNDNTNYLLDFGDFVAKLTIAKKANKE